MVGKGSAWLHKSTPWAMSYVGARKGWVEEARVLQAVAHWDREMIPGILFALSCVAIVCKCQTAASSSQCAGEGWSLVLWQIHTYMGAHTQTHTVSAHLCCRWWVSSLQLSPKAAVWKSSIIVCLSLSAGRLYQLHPSSSTNRPILSHPQSLHCTFSPFFLLIIASWKQQFFWNLPLTLMFSLNPI